MESPVPSSEETPKGLQRYKYREFGEECVAEFDDAYLAWSGTFESNSSSAHGDYQDRLRAIQLRKKGWSKAVIAKDLGRSEKFVARWWQLEPLAVPRPPGVHQYLAHSMIGGKQVDRTEMWRGVEVVRGFFKDAAGLYDEITNSFTRWKQLASETKDFRTASYFLRYDREGKMRMMSMRSTSYERGVVVRLDALVQKIHKKVGITDPDHGAGIYWFSDGDASVGSHRHVFWSARVALGADRIMMVDRTPILMKEGDLVIIGPQRHGVPSMPDVSGGSLRISVPFQPQKKPEKSQMKSNAASATAPASRGKHSSENDESLGHFSVTPTVEENDSASMPLQQLLAMGFDEALATGALRAFGDVERAADALLSCGQDSLADGLSSRWLEDGSDTSDGEDPDEALARRLQMEELAEEADEVDGELEEQFAEYDRILDIDEAERSWDRYGDLMHNPMRRANLNLDMLGPQTLYSLGAAARTEKLFFELLSLSSIRVLYDFRPTDYRDEVRSQQPHFEVRALKSHCKQRGIHYRHVAVGRETAFGVLKHLQSDEVQHILVELVWQAKHSGRTAFLGQEEDWRVDGRFAVAEELVKHGHHVQHIMSDGSCEQHTAGVEMPDFLLQEESRLRKVHAQRQAGELRRPEKSAVDRSTEAVARALASDKVQVDVSAELRDAENQDQLVRAQKRMVRLQVAEKKKEPGMSHKALVGLPSHIAREAAQAQARVEAKKAEKAKEKQDKHGMEGGFMAEDRSKSASSSSSSWQLPTGGNSTMTCISQSSLTVADVMEESDPLPSPSTSSAETSNTPVFRTGRWGQGVSRSARTPGATQEPVILAAADEGLNAGSVGPEVEDPSAGRSRPHQNRWTSLRKAEQK